MTGFIPEGKCVLPGISRFLSFGLRLVRCCFSYKLGVLAELVAPPSLEWVAHCTILSPSLDSFSPFSFQSPIHDFPAYSRWCIFFMMMTALVTKCMMIALVPQLTNPRNFCRHSTGTRLLGTGTNPAPVGA